MDDIYGKDAAPLATKWVKEQCINRHRWVAKAFTVVWADTVACLGMCLSQSLFRKRLKRAVDYCSDASSYAQRYRRAEPDFLKWPFQRILEESRLWGDGGDDLAAQHGAAWDEELIIYQIPIERKAEVDGWRVIATDSPPWLLDTATRIRVRVTEHLAEFAAGKAALFRMFPPGGDELTSCFIMQKAPDVGWHVMSILASLALSRPRPTS